MAHDPMPEFSSCVEGATLGDMTWHTLVVVVVSLGAALCYSIADVVEQRKASEAPPDTSLRIALLWHLAKQPIWWAAIAVDVTGFVLQTVALGVGEIIFVQPLLMMSLPLTLVIGHRVGSHRLSRGDLAWAFVFVTALSVFLLVGDPSGGVSQRPLSAWVIPFATVGAVVALIAVAAPRMEAVRRSVALGLAAGLLFGVTTTLTKTFADLVASEGWGMLRHWEPYVMAAVVPLSFLMLQSAFQAGDLRSALPTLDLAEPLMAGILGMALFGEQLAATGVFADIVITVCIVVMGWSTIRLARSSAASHELQSASAQSAPGQSTTPPSIADV